MVILNSFLSKEVINKDGSITYTEPQPILKTEFQTFKTKDAKGNEVEKQVEVYKVNEKVLKEDFVKGETGTGKLFLLDSNGEMFEASNNPVKMLGERIYENLADARYAEQKAENEKLKKTVSELQNQNAEILQQMKTLTDLLTKKAEKNEK